MLICGREDWDTEEAKFWAAVERSSFAGMLLGLAKERMSCEQDWDQVFSGNYSSNFFLSLGKSKENLDLSFKDNFLF